MDKIIKSGRLFALSAFLIFMIVLFLTSMYRVQIVEGGEYLASQKESTTSLQTVAAARGNILDRYGRVLVSNRACNNIVIDGVGFFEQNDDPNGALLAMAKSVMESGGTYTDTLPITKEPPFEYEYSPNIESWQRAMLQSYLSNYGLPSSTSAVELMAYFRDAFNIDPNYSAEDTRIIAGIRFEIKIRWITPTYDYIFCEDASMELVTTLLETSVAGVNIRQSYVREYETQYAAHILGYIGDMGPEEYAEYKNYDYPMDAQVGREGAELAFETSLHGQDGSALVTTTKGGTIINTVYINEPEPGNHVYLTLDIGMQEAAENALSAYIQDVNAKRMEDNALASQEGRVEDILQMIDSGAVAVVDVKTGEPLALASYPTYDLATVLEDYDKFKDLEVSPLFNRALMGRYAPGSTFKPMVAITALDTGTINSETIIECTGIYDAYADQGYAPTCWCYPDGFHGDLNVVGAIANSCNIFFYEMGVQLGIDTMSEYAYDFGLGEYTGIELPEDKGNMSTEDYKIETQDLPWYIGDSMQSAIGQMDSTFTPLQLANYCAALTQDGTRYNASILKSMRSYDYSKSIFEREAVVANVVESSPVNYDLVQEGMYKVANEMIGITYDTFANYPYTIAAKTGTSQLGEGRTNNAIFISYAPYENPEIAICVVLEHGNAGSMCAPVAKAVYDYYFAFKNSEIDFENQNTLLK